MCLKEIGKRKITTPLLLWVIRNMNRNCEIKFTPMVNSGFKALDPHEHGITTPHYCEHRGFALGALSYLLNAKLTPPPVTRCRGSGLVL